MGNKLNFEGAVDWFRELKVAGAVNILQEWSLPLILGVFAGLLHANLDPHSYHAWVHMSVFGAVYLGHKITIHFLINDVFMVTFFSVATKEITEAMLPGGDLNPLRKAVNPILGCIGGILGPVGCWLLCTWVLYDGHTDQSMIMGGWGIPTATDIALVWLVALIVFGKGHPAVNYLLLLAVADDAIGLGIIAFAYPDPSHPVRWSYTAISFAATGMAYFMKRVMKVYDWRWYMIPTAISWHGLMLAYVHPALAGVFVIPCMPVALNDAGLYVKTHHWTPKNTLGNFEIAVKLFVDFGLFFFAYANAGVELSSVNGVTWIALGSLIVGKTIWIAFFAWLGTKLGFPLPDGMSFRALFVAAVLAGLGLTVALFVAGEAFPDGNPYQAPAKMGAVLSGIVAPAIGIYLGRLWKLKKSDSTPQTHTAAAAAE